MKAIPNRSISQLIEEAQGLEANEDLKSAAELYLQVISIDASNQKAFERLMIIYRKNKDYKRELSIIKKGIAAIEKLYNSKKTKSKKVGEISEKLMKSLGLLTKSGDVYEPEPLPTWKKRMTIVEKKLAKK